MSGETRRSRIPVRWTIHSSEVFMQRARRWLSTTQSGTAIPVPTIRAFFIIQLFRPDPKFRWPFFEEGPEPFLVIFAAEGEGLGESLQVEGSRQVDVG